MDARSVFGRSHVESAVAHAERAHSRDAMSARTIAAETLRYVSGQRQVVDAIRVAGLRKGTKAIALVVWTEDDPDGLVRALRWVRDDRVLEAEGKSLEFLGITETEKGTVAAVRAADLALEKVALVDLTK